MEMKSEIRKSSLSRLILFCLTIFCVGCNKVINPIEFGSGDPANGINPSVIPNSSTSIPESSQFIPDIIDDDPYVDIGGSYDFSEQYDYTNALLTSYYATFTTTTNEGGKTVYTAPNRAIYTNRDAVTPFPYGTLSADVMNNGFDSGIVFGFSSNNSNWEGAGVSYYFYFVSQAGRAYLGKTDNGSWYVLGEKAIDGYNKATTYDIKVNYKGNKILCFVNGVHMLSYSDGSALTGTGWGIRAGGAGAVISNVYISSSFE